MRLSFIIFCFLLIIGCKKDEDDFNFTELSTTTILYMEANNDLKSEVNRTINEIENGIRPNSNFLIYLKNKDSVSYLLKVKPDQNKYKIVSDTIRIYESKEPSSPTMVHLVLSNIIRDFPTDSYSLILWSHGTAWAPPTSMVSNPGTKSFGSDRGTSMSIFDLRDALPIKFDCIIFDACSMASIEVLYEFRDKAKFIISSPTEILSDGFPYERIVPYLGKNEDLTMICKEYMNYFKNQVEKYQSASISLIELQNLEFILNDVKYASKNKYKRKENLSQEGVKKIDFSDGFPVPLYDFLSFIENNFNKEEQDRVVNSLNKAVLFKDNTTHFFEKPLGRLSGLSCYIPTTNKDNTIDSYYKNYVWYKEIYGKITD